MYALLLADPFFGWLWCGYHSYVGDRPDRPSELAVTGPFTKSEMRVLLREFLDRTKGRFTKAEWEWFLRQKIAEQEQASSSKQELERIES